MFTPIFWTAMPISPKTMHLPVDTAVIAERYWQLFGDHRTSQLGAFKRFQWIGERINWQQSKNLSFHCYSRALWCRFPPLKCIVNSIAHSQQNATCSCMETVGLFSMALISVFRESLNVLPDSKSKMWIFTPIPALRCQFLIKNCIFHSTEHS